MNKHWRKKLTVFAFLALAIAILGGRPVRSFAAAVEVDPTVAVQLAAKDQDKDDVNDPLEPMNRVFFAFNEVLQAMILKPLGELYRIFPPVVREAIGGVISNLTSPVVLINDILQGEPARAWETTSRFLINSTIGVGGLWDAGEKLFNIPGHDEDFGQTLGKWGVGEGFYVVIPILGPSNPRDAFGKFFVDAFFDPLNIWAANTGRDGIKWGRAGVGAIHTYSGLIEELDQTRKTSIDYYATIRSIWRQKRNADIRNGDDVDLPPIPDLTPDISLDTEADEDDPFMQEASSQI